MAKAKKTESASSEAKSPAKKPAAKKAAGGKSAPKPAAPAGMPMIDTNLAAASAAQMLMARKMLGAGAAPSAGSGGMVSQLKQDVAKPHKALDSLFHSTAPKQSGHSALPHQQQNQAGRAQTKGADVARTNVPRRTAG